MKNETEEDKIKRKRLEAKKNNNWNQEAYWRGRLDQLLLSTPQTSLKRFDK